MSEKERLVREHVEVTRRYFLELGTAGAAALGTGRLWAGDQDNDAEQLLKEAISRLQYLTRDEDFINFGRGTPPPHTLPPEKLRAVGLAPETWQLEVVPDPDSNAKVERPLSQAAGTALNWDGLMKLAGKHAVRILSVMSCTNGKRPCGMGLWEGVPLREVIWLARPTGNVRRVFYYGYHNDDLQQRFQSSLPIGRVLEDPPGEHPVLLCYKLNDQWLTAKRGGPVRMLVPDAYGNASVKWLQRIILTNNYQANDTYALWNNDTDSAIKTCARFLHTPQTMRPGRPAPITGVAQVGPAGLSKVQYWLRPSTGAISGSQSGATGPQAEGGRAASASDDPYFTAADWKDATILPPPTQRWGGGVPDGQLPSIPRQIDPATGRPRHWPLRNTVVHWAALLTVDGPGEYELRCRTIDAHGVAQPLPRPFPKSGNNAIQAVKLVVES
jgi:DMSO/TMAO reductase YedYZ molybdopterin-dependent catalytic subunit